VVDGNGPVRRRRAIAAALLLPFLAAEPRASLDEKTGPVAVRFPEGSLHGFLTLRAPGGEPLADGDLLQVANARGIESRMVFHFRDSSYFDERVTFSQKGVFRMEHYELVQRGRAFEQDLEVTLSATGVYSVTATSRSDGEVKHWKGTLDLPADVYNGMVITIAKNLARGDSQTVHIVAFTPGPRLIGLEIAPAGTRRVWNGRHGVATTHFKLKPKLGVILGFFARLLGRAPPDSDAWIVTDGVPGFVRFDGPLYTGPPWRLELAAPAFGR